MITEIFWINAFFSKSPFAQELYTVPEYFLYPFRELLVSCTICIASTFRSADNEKGDDNNKPLVSKLPLEIPASPEAKPNPIMPGEILKIDVLNGTTTEDEDDYNEKRSFGDPNQMKAIQKVVETLAAFKVIIIGDPRVGKSCLIKRAVKNEYDEKHEPTFGVNFSHYKLILDNNSIVRLMLWDTAG